MNYPIYGSERGGRWNAFKRTEGEIYFYGIKNYLELNTDITNNVSINFEKPMLSAILRITRYVEEGKIISFQCSSLDLSSKPKVYLRDKKDNFVDCTNMLSQDTLTCW